MSQIWTHELDVIGLKFRWTRDGRKVLARMIDSKGSISGVRFVRDPYGTETGGKHDDPNAIAVYLPERIMDGKQLGFVRRNVAELLAPRLDAGTLEVRGVRLQGLDERDDYNSGPMVVKFRDKPAKRPTKAKKGKARK